MKSRYERETRKPKKEKSLITDKTDMELVIDQEELNEEMLNQPLLLRKYTKLKAEVSAKAKAVKDNSKRVEARAHIRLKSEMHGAKVKDLEVAVELDEEVIAAREELIEAERLLEEYEGIVRAFWQRHEALKELSANRRKEVID